MKNFSSILEKWYLENQRDLPWRKTRDPYLIWISEIIFQQTRINQGFDYYNRFVKAFPSIQNLASAEEAEVLKQWQGLGYYSRARNLYKTAQIIVNQHHGVFPTETEAIQKLPGIGEYTAAAISSFAFLKPTPVIDGNVIRFISRLYGLELLFTTEIARKELSNLLNTLINKKRPDIFNNAIMEFGALQCKPMSPDCEICVFKSVCIAFKENKISELPLKVKKKTNPIICLDYLVFVYKDKNDVYTWLHKRTDKGIWQNLYEFPCFEGDKKMGMKQILKTPLFTDLSSESEIHYRETSPRYIHKLTHKTFHAHYHIIEICKSNSIHLKSYYKTSLVKAKEFPVSRLMEIFFMDLEKASFLIR